MSTTDPTLERVVHAFNSDDTIELVRYDRAGKWKLEWKDGRSVPIKCRQAATVAILWEKLGGTIFPRQYGGTTFMRHVEEFRLDP